MIVEEEEEARNEIEIEIVEINIHGAAEIEEDVVDVDPDHAVTAVLDLLLLLPPVVLQTKTNRIPKNVLLPPKTTTTKAAALPKNPHPHPKKKKQMQRSPKINVPSLFHNLSCERMNEIFAASLNEKLDVKSTMSFYFEIEEQVGTKVVHTSN